MRILWLLVPAFSYELPMCIQCKHFKIDTYGKCCLFPIDKLPIEKDYHYCVTARSYEYMCGEKGKQFEPNYSL